MEIERGIFDRLRTAILDQAARIGQAARALAEIDLACAFAIWPRARAGSGRASMTAAPSSSRGRHPVVERALRRKAESFVANDCDLTTGATPAIWLLTGPNMAGKSTFLRQNALIAVLAQAGPLFLRGARISGWSASCFPAWAPPTTWRGAVDLHGRDGGNAAILNQAMTARW